MPLAATSHCPLGSVDTNADHFLSRYGPGSVVGGTTDVLLPENIILIICTELFPVSNLGPTHTGPSVLCQSRSDAQIPECLMRVSALYSAYIRHASFALEHLKDLYFGTVQLLMRASMLKKQWACTN